MEWVGVRPSLEHRTPTRDHNHKENAFSLPQQLLTANSLSARGGIRDLLSAPCWNVNYIDILQTAIAAESMGMSIVTVSFPEHAV